MKSKYISVGDYWKSITTANVYEIVQIFSINKDDIYFRIHDVVNNKSKIVSQTHLEASYNELKVIKKVTKILK